MPRGHCWVEGDEGFHSRDSNAFGPVSPIVADHRRLADVDSPQIPLGLIDGRLEAIITPLRCTRSRLERFNSADSPPQPNGTFAGTTTFRSTRPSFEGKFDKHWQLREQSGIIVRYRQGSVSVCKQDHLFSFLSIDRSAFPLLARRYRRRLRRRRSDALRSRHLQLDMVGRTGENLAERPYFLPQLVQALPFLRRRRFRRSRC